MKKILIALASIVVLALVVAAVLPKDFKIEQSTVIAKPKAEVFAYLKNLENGRDWEPWSKMDPEMTYELKGVDGNVGAIAAWSGNSKVGTGEQEIVGITENERIDFALRFTKPMKATNKAYFIVEDADENQTKVTWGMEGRTPYPFNLICNLMRENVEKDFAEGLVNLRMILEAPALEIKSGNAPEAVVE